MLNYQFNVLTIDRSFENVFAGKMDQSKASEQIAADFKINGFSRVYFI